MADEGGRARTTSFADQKGEGRPMAWWPCSVRAISAHREARQLGFLPMHCTAAIAMPLLALPRYLGPKIARTRLLSPVCVVPVSVVLSR